MNLTPNFNTSRTNLNDVKTQVDGAEEAHELIISIKFITGYNSYSLIKNDI